MRKRRKELDVDVIGNQKETITKEEEKMISDFIHLCKTKKTKKATNNKMGA